MTTLPRLTSANLETLHKQWRANPNHQRFGQYVMNNTKFNINIVNGVDIWNSSDDRQVHDALTHYLMDIQS